MARTAPYGSWGSPVSASFVARAGVRFGQVSTSEAGIWWEERRPAEGGRVAVVRRSPSAEIADVFSDGFSARSAVHEYGGGSSFVSGETLFFSNWDDQRLYRLDPHAEPVPITPAPERPRALRYADGVVTPDGETIVCVRERHAPDAEAVSELVVLPADGSSEPRVIASGHDFFSFPRLSPDGRRLAWTTWDHPNMPWDSTTLWVAPFDGELGEPTAVAGGPEESIFQPAWSPQGVLHFVSDRNGWWNLYELGDTGPEIVVETEAEFGRPQWVFGMSTYAFLPNGDIVCAYVRDGVHRLGRITAGVLEPIDVASTEIHSVFAAPDGIVVEGASPTEPASIMLLDLEAGRTDVLKRSADLDIDPAYVSAPESITFPTDAGLEAHALYYPPRNPDVTGPTDEQPPLLVLSHGGPTSQTTAAFDAEIQFWTTRGFAVVDVNYGGSTGYGRAYRDRLRGTWGIVDVADCANAARYLAERGDVDPRRVCIRGGSAGGYTTLCALVETDLFRAGAIKYGVADLEALLEDTHKFESRYEHGLVGSREVLRERSPVHHADRITCPLIVFQGLEDTVVPPSQSEAIVSALDDRGVPHAYLTFEGEQHGFRKAETIERVLEAELSFYGQVLGFEPAGDIEPVEIEGLR